MLPPRQPSPARSRMEHHQAVPDIRPAGGYVWGRILVVLLCGALTGCTSQGSLPPTATNEATTQSAPKSSPGTAQPNADTSPSASPPVPTSSERPKTPIRKPSVVDPPVPVEGQVGETEVVRTSDGTACRISDTALVYGGYPAASCNLWQRAKGLRTGELAKKGAKRVACQRNLGRENPVYKQGQVNTWWVWTTSTSGTWDWFPETAVAEGASSQPINGIALCHPRGRGERPRAEQPKRTTQPKQPGEDQPDTKEEELEGDPSSSTIGEGTFIVGEDIKPGRYKARADGDGSCYWARMKDDSGDSDSIIANNITDGSASVTIKESDGAFETSGCTPWIRQ